MKTIAPPSLMLAVACLLVGCGAESGVAPASEPTPAPALAPVVVNEQPGTAYLSASSVCLAPGEPTTVELINDSEQATGYSDLNPVNQNGVTTFQMWVISGGIIEVTQPPATYPPIAQTVLPAGTSVELTITAPPMLGEYVLTVGALAESPLALAISVANDCADTTVGSLPTSD